MNICARPATLPFVIVIALAANAPGAAAQGPAKRSYQRLDPQLTEMLTAVDAGRPSAEVTRSVGNALIVNERVPVSIVCTDTPGVLSRLRAAGADVRNASGDVVEAYATLEVVRELDTRSDVTRVRLIEPPQDRAISQGRAVHNAANWQTGGFAGTGVKVGIIDSFQGLVALMGSELPSVITGRCYSSIGVFSAALANCQTNSAHGTAVAESLVDIAPGVQLYIGNPSSFLDFRSTIDWMVSQGVRVINYSAARPWDGPGNGTSPYSDSPLRSVDAAVSGGAVFVTAAGNEGRASWLGPFIDLDGNGWAEFDNSGFDDNAVFLVAGQNVRIQLRWQDNWGGATKDLDLLLYTSTYTLVAASVTTQSGAAGDVPFEFISYTAPATGVYNIGVNRFSGAAPGWIQLQNFTSDELFISTTGGSIGNPAESANPGVLAVGAANWTTPSTIESYSSRGPTPDGRVKPDIVGADQADTVTYGANGFAGTSQASPHVAGLAALVLQAFPAFSPSQVADYLKNFAAQRASPNPNNIWGRGFAMLPDLCTYTLNPPSATIGVAGAQASFTVTTGAGCAWTAVPSASFITIVGSNSGTGSGTVTYAVAASNVATQRIGIIAVGGQQFSVTQLASVLPTMSVDRVSLNFSAVNAGNAFVVATSAQTLRLVQSGAGTVGWTATSNSPWLIVSPSSGTGTRPLSVSVQFSPSLPAVATGSITIALTGAGNTISPVTVRLNVTASGASTAPVGSFDTPLDGTAGVTGSIGVTGWAMDDVQVTRLRIERDAVVGETPGVRVFLGDASFVDGARPDVAAAFPTSPMNTRAGWGYLMLTNFLPGLGNGTFKLYAIAEDADGHSTILGTKTITCTNATATNPFGAIDTPGQGATVSGVVNNFGWVLAPGARKADPLHGGTVVVIIDGAVVGSPDGWVSRTDLTSLFPVGQFSGIANALAVYTFDSSTLTNGVHTIAWVVTDNLGGVAGIGSRYFTVSNGAGLQLTPAAAGALQISPTRGPLKGRRGPDLDAPFEPLTQTADGVFAFAAEELDRIELRVTAMSGHLRSAMGNLPLPVGSRIDARDGTFTWQIGPGFIGSYDLVFDTPAGTQTVRVMLYPQGMLSRPQVIIDTPTQDEELSGSFIVAGWAVDPNAKAGTGIDAMHVWAYPLRGGMPIFLGATTLTGERPDVEAIYGVRASRSGYGINIDGLPPGSYDIALFAWSVVEGRFLPARTRRVLVR